MLSELEALVILTSIAHLGSVRIRLLLDFFGSARATLQAKAAEIEVLPGFGKKVAQEWNRWRSDDSWKWNLELVQKHGVELIPYTSGRYPKRLLEIPDYPVLLYVKGSLLPEDQQSIAVVGTRHASIYGNEMAEKISKDLAGSGFTVVSGLARGIDTAAHMGALRKGRTIAVIGSGLADIYPQENVPLARAIVERGALISEFPMATPPDRQNFPQRNRIVAAMTLGTLLIEAPSRSGAMITMDKALTYERKLFALPGRADTDSFKGNHQLIKAGQAQLIENAQDVIAHFQDLFNFFGEKVPVKTTAIQLEKEEATFYNRLPNQEVTFDQIMQLTQLPVMKVNVMIMSLVLKKVLKQFPGKVYKKVVYNE